MSRFTSFQAERERIDFVVGALAAVQDGKFADNLRILKRRLIELDRAFAPVLQLDERRERLIGRHVHDPNVPFVVHLEYHHVSASLMTATLGAHSHLKTFLNDLTVFVITSLKPDQARGLRKKGFGALVESATRLQSTSDLATVRLIAGFGRSYDDEHVEYRNKNLEHAGTLLDRSLSTGGALRILHNHESSGGQYHTRINDGTHQKEGRVILDVEGGQVHYFHVAPAPGIATGTLVEPRETVGYVSGHPDHFEEWGPHHHMFGTAGLALDNLEDADQYGEIKANRSPDVFKAMFDGLQLCRLATIAVGTDLSNFRHAGNPNGDGPKFESDSAC